MIMAGVRQPELPVFPESMMRSSARHRQSPLAGIKLLSHDPPGAPDKHALQTLLDRAGSHSMF
jgi:hypothetical protein